MRRIGPRSVETEATTTVANAWETLTFNFANQAAGTAPLNLAYTYNKVSIFFNFGVTGATAGREDLLLRRRGLRALSPTQTHALLAGSPAIDATVYQRSSDGLVVATSVARLHGND